MELVKGLSRADQAEVDSNRVATHCNVAAAHLAGRDFGAAAAACDAALALDPGCRKARARRARANLGRHELGAAAEDIAALRGADPFDPEVGALEAAARRKGAEGRAAERAAFGNMFGASTSAA